MKADDGRFRARPFVGSETVYEYEFRDSAGQRLKIVSRLEVIRNYEIVVRQLGATDIHADDHSLVFQFKDRGDGRPVMGAVDAYSGNYSIAFFMVDEDKP